VATGLLALAAAGVRVGAARVVLLAARPFVAFATRRLEELRSG
jgi:hypothetical protein